MTKRRLSSVRYHKAAEELLRSGKAHIHLPVRSEVAATIPLFLAFLAEPEEYKLQWTFNFQRPGDDGEPDDGYVRRDGGTHDYKAFFHYRPALQAALHNRGVDLRSHERFLAKCGLLFRDCDSTMKLFAAALDSILPGFSMRERLSQPAAEELHVLRLLYYDKPRAVGGVIGKAHTDRAFMTIHVDESHPGLRFGASRELYRAQPDHSLIFPSDKASRLTRGRLAALEHVITDEHDGVTGALPNRWSMVYFAHIDLPLPKKQ